MKNGRWVWWPLASQFTKLGPCGPYYGELNGDCQLSDSESVAGFPVGPCCGQLHAGLLSLGLIPPSRIGVDPGAMAGTSACGRRNLVVRWGHAPVTHWRRWTPANCNKLKLAIIQTPEYFGFSYECGSQAFKWSLAVELDAHSGKRVQ